MSKKVFLRLRPVSALAGGVIVLLAAVVAPAQATHRDNPAATGRVQPMAQPTAVAPESTAVDAGDTLETQAEAENEEATAYATVEGITLVVAKARLAEQGRLDGLVDSLQASYPSTFSGAVISDNPYAITISFVGTVPSGAVSLATTDGVNATFSPDATSSSIELTTSSSNAVSAVEQSEESGVVAVDEKNDVVDVYIEEPSGKTGSGTPLRQWKSQLRHRLEGATGNGPLHITFGKPDPVKEQGAPTNGGAQENSSGSYACTAGFPVAQGSTYGEMTAGHCPNSLTYVPPTGSTTWPLTFQAQHRGTYGDFQWGAPGATHPVTANFYVGNTSLRTVMGLKTSFSQGQLVCKFGRTSGQGCSDVYRVNFSVVDGSVTLGHLVATKASITQGGDSGGPWWATTNHAAGIHFGLVKFSASDTYHSTFSRFDQIANAFSNMAYVCGCAS